MYIHTSFPNYTFALDLNDPGHILWQDKPKQNPAARSVACCDLVNRGLAYWPGDGKTPPLILKTLLDGNVAALNANTARPCGRSRTLDIKVGSTLTIAPYVVKDKVIIGSSGAELGVRGYLTAYDVKTGAQVWRAYATGPDQDLLLADDFNIKNAHYGQKNLGTTTWEGDAWKIGGGTNWGWYAYDPGTNMIYFGTGNPAPWNETMRPGDNKWTMTIFGRDADTGQAISATRRRSRRVGLCRRQRDDAVRAEGQGWEDEKLLTHPDRNGIVYTLDRTDGSLVSANKIDDTVNVFKSVDLKTARRYATRNTAPGWTTSPRTSVPPRWAITTRVTIPMIRSVKPSSWASTTSAWIGSPSCCPTVRVSSSSAQR